MRLFKVIVFTIFIAFLCLTARFASALTQEGNPVPYLKAIATYEWNNSPYEKIVETTKKGRYITGFDSEDPYSALKDYMENKGWEFKDQMGSGFIFEKDDELITIETRQYSRNYYIWDIPTPISERDFTN